MTYYDLEELTSESQSLPALPEIYFRVSELIDDENATMYDIGVAVQSDPSLTSKILKLVNSAFFGLATEITSIGQALSLIGQKQLRHILMGSVLSEIFSDIYHPDFSMHDFWEHSIRTAIISRHLALQNANIIDHDAFFTAGLLHDIGRLIIVKELPEIQSQLGQNTSNNSDFILSKEKEILGFTHADVSRAVLKKWALPGMLVQAAYMHHQTDHQGPFAIDTAIVYVANILSHYKLDDDLETLRKSIQQEVTNWQQTQCTIEQISIACHLADEQVHEVLESLGMAEADTTSSD